MVRARRLQWSTPVRVKTNLYVVYVCVYICEAARVYGTRTNAVSPPGKSERSLAEAPADGKTPLVPVRAMMHFT